MKTVSTRTKHFAPWLVVGLVLSLLVACGGEDSSQYERSDGSYAGDTAAVTVPALSAQAQAGEAVFNANCTLCHGVNAAGTNLGPPLVHKIYEPSHHQDFSFRKAVQKGVQSHHWQFGNMVPVPGVADDDIERIICYVRELQRANGIFTDEAGLAAC